MKYPGCALVLAVAALALCTEDARADSGREAVAKMAATWSQVKTYECTVKVHEAAGKRVQDRVYLIHFARPTHTRVDIIDGDGRGSAAVWNGGDRVRGHQGGILSFIRLNVDLHSSFATDLRGTTIVQSNFGALLGHLQALDPSILHATTIALKTVLVVQIDPASPKSDVTKEVYILGSNWLPLEFFEYAKDKLVRHVVNSGLKVNIDIPESTWRL
jgi:outer membrane lipoprotein-sorting protein